jgi:hypothetical protein
MSPASMLMSLPAGYSPLVLAACELHSLTADSRLTHTAAIPHYIASAQTAQKILLPTVPPLLRACLLPSNCSDIVACATVAAITCRLSTVP